MQQLRGAKVYKSLPIKSNSLLFIIDADYTFKFMFLIGDDKF